MKQILLPALMVFSLFFVLTDSSAGQSTHKIKVSIPFDFFVLGEKLPAGQYTIERLNAGKPSQLLIKGGPLRRSKIFFTQRVESVNTRDSAWIFRRYGDQYFLSAIWEVGERAGQRLPESEYERQLRETRKEVSIVSLVKEVRSN